jgi:putative thioredoxin
VDVTEENFESEVIERSREVPVVVDLWAEWCGPCRALTPMLVAEIQARGGAVRLAKINVDEAQQLAAAFRVEGIPAVRIFRDAKIVLGFDGLVSKEQLTEAFDRVMPTKADKSAEDAKTKETRAPADAEAQYRQALERDPDHQESLVGLARVLLAQGKDGEAAALLDRASPEDDLAAEVTRLRALLALREKGREVGDEAATRKRLSAEPNNPQRRYEFGCALAVAGKYPEALEELLQAATADRKVADEKVKPVMVQIFQVIGVRSDLADEYRDKLRHLLY